MNKLNLLLSVTIATTMLSSCQKGKVAEPKAKDANKSPAATTAPAQAQSVDTKDNSADDKSKTQPIANVVTEDQKTEQQTKSENTQNQQAEANQEQKQNQDTKENSEAGTQTTITVAEEETKEKPSVKAEEPQSGEEIVVVDEKKAADLANNKIEDAIKAAESSGKGKVSAEEFPIWEELTAYAANFGVKQDSGRGFYSSLTDSNMTDFMKDHTDRHFSVIGGPDSKGQFQFLRVEGVWETWKVTSDNLVSCDQWQFLVTRDGAVAQIYRKVLVEDANKRVYKHEDVAFTEEEGLKKWVEFKAFWYNKVKEKKAKPTATKK